MSVITSLLIIIAASGGIFFAGDKFATASSRLGKYLRMPPSIKAATFDAISSSLPELLVALFAVISFRRFEVGIGTIVGSAFFNLLIIPGICVLVSPVVFKLNKKVITRDAVFYSISLVLLLLFLLTTKTWGLLIALILLATYGIYIFIFAKDTKTYKQKEKPKKENINLKKELFIAIVTMSIIAVASFYLTKEAIVLSQLLHVSAVIISFTIIAIATSLPDATISIVNARRGLSDDAISNVFGSNTFDILVGLGLPLLIATSIAGPVTIVFTNIELVIGLLITTGITIYFMANDGKISKTEGIIMILLFCIFVGYTIFLSLQGA